jgi:hypothetical protein
MAWIEQHRRADGGLTARVIWRPGGTRDATRVWETFGAGSDAQNLARADGFKRMVEAAGQRWPDGWVKGEGFVRPPDVADPLGGFFVGPCNTHAARTRTGTHARTHEDADDRRSRESSFPRGFRGSGGFLPAS